MKRASISFLGGSLAALVLVIPGTADAQNNKNKKRNNAPHTRKSAPSELPVVKRVSGDSITVGGKQYMVTESTRVTVNGKPAALGDIKAGMQASVSGGVLEYGKTRADTIYKATRISARTDNKLDAKRKEYNKKQAERARRNNRNNNRRR